jgi:DNA topoisomerase IB
MRLEVLFESVEEAVEPAGYFTYSKMKFPYWGNPKGRNRTLDYAQGKFNRYAKLGLIADAVTGTFKDMIKRDSFSLDSRCAFACLIMMEYGIRIGNEDSAEGYESHVKHLENEGEIVQTYGTTTLLNNHITVGDGILSLHFLGKEQVEHNIQIRDPFIVEYGAKYHRENAPDEKWLGLDYPTLFKFVKDNIGDGFVPKDLRTFCANVTAWLESQKYLKRPKTDTKSDAKKEVKEWIEKVAKRLGNTPSVARSRYVDHRLLDWFVDQRYTEND